MQDCVRELLCKSVIGQELFNPFSDYWLLQYLVNRNSFADVDYQYLRNQSFKVS